MIELERKLQKLAGEIRKKYENIKSKESTKVALTMPLLQALGYDVFDPAEVVPDYMITVEHQAPYTVDYVIMQGGKPSMLVACTHWGTNLDKEKNPLYEIFPLTQARIGILTNGVVYRFYTDSDKPGKMDAIPFFELNVMEVTDTSIDTLSRFLKHLFSLDALLPAAKELKREREKSIILRKILNKHAVHKKEFLIYIREDIFSSVLWSLMEFYKGVVVANGCNNFKRLEIFLFTMRCDLLIIDECYFESLDAFCEFIYTIQYSNAKFKILAIMSSQTDLEQVQRLLKKCDVIVDILVRPFTLKRMYGYVESAFGLKKPVETGVKHITNVQIKSGMILAENVYIPGKDEPLIECGVVLGDAHILDLIKHNISKIKVHEDSYKFINCWEFKKCTNFEDCPAFLNVDADGFLEGVNAGRACMYINATMDMCGGGRRYKSWEEKIKVICHDCDFYTMITTSNDNKIPPSAQLIEHMDKNVKKRKNMDAARNEFEQRKRTKGGS
ncbi:MAG: hypothetical protein HQK88_07705 [Nitrospirae bacterium]|nr:hypothetical protein [Nitrospirota bacterium]MBF0533661.1 hypothetical protein [Nitrospirota bacterium]MBF0616688.1 hypothetical protein [Nitrospirota bacterium]